MRKILIFVLIFVLISLVLAINIEIEKKSSDEVMIYGLDDSVVFDLEIINLGGSNSFEFYNLVGFEMFPIGTVYMGQGQTKDVQVKISPIGEFDYRGIYTFVYFIRG
ncbi:unnamed protein product, partial [marine sediment metagenome]